MALTQQNQSGGITEARTRLLLETLATSCLAAAVAFLLLTALHARLARWNGFDEQIQAAIHGWTHPLLTLVMQGLTIVGSTKFFVPVLVLVLAMRLLKGERAGGSCQIRARHAAIVYSYAVAGALTFNEILKAHFHRLRPTDAWAIGHETTFSFPSGHAIFAMVLYGTLAWRLLAPRGRGWSITLACALMACGIGLSRIYLGVHWPTDVLGGYLAGACWLAAVVFLDRRLEDRLARWLEEKRAQRLAGT